MAYEIPYDSQFKSLGYHLAYDVSRLTHLSTLAEALAGLTDYSSKYKSCISGGIGLFEVAIDKKIIGYASIEKNDIGTDVETVLLNDVINKTGFKDMDEYVESYPDKYIKYLKEPDEQDDDDVDEDEISDMMDEIFEDEEKDNKTKTIVRAKPEKITPVKNPMHFEIIIEMNVEKNTVIASYPTIYDLSHCDDFTNVKPKNMWYCEDWSE